MLEKIVKNYLMIDEFDMILALATADGEGLLAAIKENPPIGLYFLDIDLNQRLNGVELAAEIRNYDTFGKIIFITSHKEAMHQVFEHRVEAMDYIIKDKESIIQQRVYDCMKLAEERHQNDRLGNQRTVTIRIGHQVRTFKEEDIMFVETSGKPHRLILHLAEGQIDYYGNIKEAEQFSNDFVRCHRTVVVNKKNIAKIDKKSLLIEMNNGSSVYASTKGLRKCVDD